MAKNSFVLRLGVVRVAQRLHVNDLDIAQHGSSRYQRIDQGRSRAAPRLVPYMIARANRFQRLSSIHALVPILFAPVHHRLPLRSSPLQLGIEVSLLIQFAVYEHSSFTSTHLKMFPWISEKSISPKPIRFSASQRCAAVTRVTLLSYVSA